MLFEKDRAIPSTYPTFSTRTFDNLVHVVAVPIPAQILNSTVGWVYPCLVKEIVELFQIITVAIVIVIVVVVVVVFVDTCMSLIQKSAFMVDSPPFGRQPCADWVKATHRLQR